MPRSRPISPCCRTRRPGRRARTRSSPRRCRRSRRPAAPPASRASQEHAVRDMVSLDKKAAIPQRPAFARWLGTTNEVTRGFLATGHIPDLINLAGGLPAPEIYPAEELAELARRAVAEHPAETLGYGPVEGLPELRDALASRFSTGELQLRRENVLVTSSGM